jgi:heme/copper-type cytochrome/quinol oxidase subunit 1
MKLRSLNGSQRGVIVVALGFAIYIFGQWLLETLEFGSRPNVGWVAYAPLSNSFNNVGQIRILHPWVVLLFWLLAIAVWLVASLAILRSRSDQN